MIHRTDYLSADLKQLMLHEWSIIDWHNWIQKADHPAAINQALVLIAPNRSKSLNAGARKWAVIREMLQDRRRQLY